MKSNVLQKGQPSEGRRSTLQELWKLLRESVLVQALITIAMVGLIVYMTITGKDVPKEIWALTGLIVGYYFKSKNDLQSGRTADAIEAMAAIASTTHGPVTPEAPKDLPKCCDPGLLKGSDRAGCIGRSHPRPSG